MDYIKLIETEQLKANIPKFKAGDTVRVKIKVIEGGRERLQNFEGICIERKHSGIKENFTLRKISAHGVGVERTFPIHSPRLQNIEVIKMGNVRQSRLYYLRKKIGKHARIKEKKYIPENKLAENQT